MKKLAILPLVCGCGLLSDPSTYLAGTPSSGGPGFFDRAATQLRSNALRLSIEWSRVFPVSTIGVSDLRSVANPQALAYYHSVFSAMKARELTPFVTLDHYTLPAWPHDAADDVQSASDIGYLMNDVPGRRRARRLRRGVERSRGTRRRPRGKDVRATVEGVGNSIFPDQSPYMTFNPFSLALTPDAGGLAEVLDFMKSYGKPLYITETGIEDPQDSGKAADWTLMDNYEWNHGMTWKLGMYGVDANDPAKTRVARPKAIPALAAARP